MMGFKVSIEPEHRLGRIRLFDVVTGSSLMAATRTLFTHADWSSNYNTLWDARPIDLLDVNPVQLQELQIERARFGAALGPGISVFLVRRDIDYLIAKLFEATNRVSERTIVTTYSAHEAASLLGVAPGVVD